MAPLRYEAERKRPARSVVDAAGGWVHGQGRCGEALKFETAHNLLACVSGRLVGHKARSSPSIGEQPAARATIAIPCVHFDGPTLVVYRRPECTLLAPTCVAGSTHAECELDRVCMPQQTGTHTRARMPQQTGTHSPPLAKFAIVGSSFFGRKKSSAQNIAMLRNLRATRVVG